MTTPHLVVRPERAGDRPVIHALRHEVYALELGQHAVNEAGTLADALDPLVEYLVAERAGTVVGFVALTPPTAGRWSLEKYLPQADLPGPPHEATWEIRLLTTIAAERGGRTTVALALASLRWLEARGATHVIGMGRAALMPMYARCGLVATGQVVHSGAVEFHVMEGRLEDTRAQYERQRAWIERAMVGVDLSAVEGAVPGRSRSPGGDVVSGPAYHGGAFFEAIGTDLRTLERRHDVVPADVLDAWFPPSPRVLDAVRAHLDWLARTSPPTHCEGVVQAVARQWQVPADCVVPAAGSSDLIFRCLPRWVRPEHRVLLLDPTYGEYRHVFTHVIGCQVESVPLRPQDGFAVDLARELPPERLQGVALVVLVNPNSPTGQAMDPDELARWLDTVPAGTRVWVDETYLAYAREADPAQRSLAPVAALREDLVVVTSLSKAWALSGMRAAHLVAAPATAAQVRRLTPPWVMSLPTQLAVVEALADTDYYRAQWQQTARLRDALAADLESLGCQVVPGAVATFLLVRLPEAVSARATVVAAREHGVFLRTTDGMGEVLADDTWLRTAVRSGPENARIVQALRSVWGM